MIPQATDQRRVEPLHIIAAGVEEKDFIAEDRDWQEEGGSNRDSQGKRAHSQTDPPNHHFSFPLQIFILVAVKVASQDEVAGNVQDSKKEEEDDVFSDGVVEGLLLQIGWWIFMVQVFHLFTFSSLFELTSSFYQRRVQLDAMTHVNWKHFASSDTGLSQNWQEQEQKRILTFKTFLSDISALFSVQ